MLSQSRIALFIDGANLHFTARALGFEVDFKRLLCEFEKRGFLLRAYFYTTVNEEGDYSNIRPLVDWLDYNGFAVRAKRTKEFDDGEGRRKIKRNICVELAVDAFEVASHVNEIILFSGDGDYQALLAAIQRRGVHVTVVSSSLTVPPMVAEALKRQADSFLELNSLRPSIERSLQAVAGRVAKP
jgi:uncharacterized LabA/DUF88 family protein